MTKLKNWVKSNSWNWSRLFLRKQHFRFLWKEQRAKWGKHFQTWGCDILEFQRRHWSVLAMKFHLQISCKINFHNSLSSCLHIQIFFYHYLLYYHIWILMFSVWEEKMRQRHFTMTQRKMHSQISNHWSHKLKKSSL